MAGNPTKILGSRPFELPVARLPLADVEVFNLAY